MVADEAAVLPDARALDPDDDGSPFAFEDIDGDHRPRAPRPSQDDGWLDTDHYTDEAPSEPCAAAEWRHAHRDVEPITVNGAIMEQWRHGSLGQALRRVALQKRSRRWSGNKEDDNCLLKA